MAPKTIGFLNGSSVENARSGLPPKKKCETASMCAVIEITPETPRRLRVRQWTASAGRHLNRALENSAKLMSVAPVNEKLLTRALPRSPFDIARYWYANCSPQNKAAQAEKRRSDANDFSLFSIGDSSSGSAAAASAEGSSTSMSSPR